MRNDIMQRDCTIMEEAFGKAHSCTGLDTSSLCKAFMECCCGWNFQWQMIKSPAERLLQCSLKNAPPCCNIDVGSFRSQKIIGPQTV